jgi:hypothetical protein
MSASPRHHLYTSGVARILASAGTSSAEAGLSDTIAPCRVLSIRAR